MYNKTEEKPIGKKRVQVVNPRNGKKYSVEFVVVKGKGKLLLGLRASEQMQLISVVRQNIMALQAEEPSQSKTPLTTESILEEYAYVLREGKLEGDLHLEIDPNIPPVQLPTRKVPIAIKEKLKEEINRLEGLNIITPVNVPTSWISATVVTMKKNGNVRLFKLSGEDIQYANVKQKFKDHFKGKVALVFERTQFVRRCQQDKESVLTFIEDLQRRADLCSFGDLRDQMVHTQIIAGLPHSHLRRRLMANDNLTLDQVIKEVKSAEITKHHDQILQNPSSAADISAIHDRKVPENKRRSPKPKHGVSSKAKKRSCYRCGAQPGHPPQRCPAKDATCNACNKKGHYSKVCKSSKQVRRVNYDSEEDDISVMTVNEVVNTIETSEKWRTNLSIGNSEVNFKIDTGTDVTVIPEEVFCQCNLGKLHYTSKRLFGADHKGLCVIGTIRDTLSLGEKRVPLPMKSKVKEELSRMEKLGVIRKVDKPTNWCAGMVTVPKPNGKIRICVDLTKLNENVCRETYPLLKIEALLGEVGESTVFTKTDASSGFWQEKLAENSQLLTTFLTPVGRYCFQRLTFGLKSAPERFQKRMLNELEGLEGVICIMDDILVHGKTQKQHDERLDAVLTRLIRARITLNPEKCEFSRKQLKFAGHSLSAQGIGPDPDKTAAIE
ncbi:Retrovirus-related Pol polyprotein from transposon opus [Stylophora pistillata]|uniref:Retrovirus-related Pol polyprotein from transposon opus n=1 Tax=Stylophora pistillata TaxID=50429 RepID=A0A2B4R8B5_STYPI|nr:Retrovirus-related Pol polyprotein from transposon opus [Stylophora pistillata]